MAASVQSMYEYWKKFDLQELQKELDSTATEIANRQDDSEGSRKRLVEQSREFKKNTPEDIRKIVSPLLKCFQSEVDALIKRSKASETAFLSVYKRLIDLPDPISVLEYALQVQKKAQRVQDLEIENKQLRETLDEYNHEFAEVKNQEVTIKQLKEKLKEGEDKVEAVAEARTKEKERELQKIFAEKERQLQETQLTVARKLGEAEQRVSTLTNTLENVQSELFEVKTKYEEATSAKSAEMEMVMADLERANEKASAAERETDKLKHQLTNLTASLSEGGQTQRGPDMEQAIEILQRSNLEAELAAKEKEISQLVEDVQRLQASLHKLRETTTQEVSRLEEELTLKDRTCRRLEDQLRSQEDYEEIKRELSVMKSIEFSTSSPTDEVDGDFKPKSLDMLLIEKNKALQNENTQMKVSINDVSGKTPPAISSHVDTFTSLIGGESATTFHGTKHTPFSSFKNGEITSPTVSANSPKQESSAKAFQGTNHTPFSSFKNGGITSPTVSANSPKQESSAVKAQSPESADIPPQVPSSPHSDTGRHTRPPSTSDSLRFPPQSPQFFNPHSLLSQGSSHFMNYLGMNLGHPIKSEVNGCQGLDTGMVAKTVRELLSIHNIGQRLFAKHVLGLSQGTVSELLSKPKSWDKLTEKGRESYRKMHSWAADDRSILALKAISPKKGTQPLLPNIPREDTETEERIAQILNEAQQAMQNKKSMEQVWTKEHHNAMVSSIYQQMAHSYNHMHVSHALPITSPTPGLTSPHPSISDRERFRKLSGGSDKHHEKQSENELSAKEMVERIYRQELIKLAQAAENAGNIAASALYQQELARLAHNVRMRDDPEPGEVRHIHGSPDRMIVKSEPQDSSTCGDDIMNQSNGPIDLSKHSTSSSSPSTPTSGGSDKSLNSSAHTAASAFFQVRPRINGHELMDGAESQATPTNLSPTPHVAFGSHPSSTENTNASPLQRMQNIANSLMTRPHIGAPNNKPLKAVLPPITQEEFDSYANINTEELVKQVKETLSQYSISQRLFGENVLGLSQGSVSDLLARPKPWHMLTQKGREPFIRMQLFLEDAEAIPKLVASQYHIAPDKLMRSNSMSKEQDLDNQMMWPTIGGNLPATPLPLVNPLVSPMTLGMSGMSAEKFEAIAHMGRNMQYPTSLEMDKGWQKHVSSSDMKPAPPTVRPPNVPPTFPVPPVEPHPSLFTHLQHHHHQQPPNWASSFTYPSSMLEIVAMTSEIDTLDLTGRVKDVLQFNNLGQKLFGEAVLGLSQGSVSELLSKPKPWHMLSIKGREPFIKMHLWLSDPHNVERLKHCQNEIKANRRRRHSLEDRYDAPMALPKRPRVFFSEEQKDRLRQAYNRDPYPNQSTIEALANTLNVGVKTVINWFHNHRMRAKQQQHDATSPSTTFNDFNQTSGGKEESNDDNSNNSDLSSMSGDNRENINLSGFPSRFSNTDSSQWMFPQFEPVNMKHIDRRLDINVNDTMKLNDNELSDHDNINQDELDGELSSPNSTKDIDEAKESDKDEDMDTELKDENSNTEIFDRSEKDYDFAKGQIQNMMTHSGANKRKRSHPQYVSAGRHLDRTVNDDDSAKGVNVIEDGGEELKRDDETEKENSSGNAETSDINTDLTDKWKLVSGRDEPWDNNSSSVEKIQNNLTQHSSENWEF